jgi:predicted RNA polymerase sigma factor
MVSGEAWCIPVQQSLFTNYSPVSALNRTYALSKVKGAATAISEAERLSLSGNRFYHAC